MTFYYQKALLISPLFTYIVLKPYYFWSSGYPQVADFTFLVLTSIVFIIFRSIFRFNYILFAILFFIAYTFFVNAFFAMLHQDYGGMVYPIFYAFNGLFIIYAFNIINYNIINYRIWTRMTFLSLFFILASSPIFFEVKLRQDLAFNNPNQLGSFAMMVVIISLYFLTIEKKKLDKSSSFIIAVGSILALLSLSVGSIMGILLAISIYIFLFNRRHLLKFLLLASIMISSISYFVINNSEFVSAAESRLVMKLEKSNEAGIIQERGYDRILNHPEYLFFGAGEGQRDRFESFLIDGTRSLELHSTIGTILFSYGFIIFGAFIYLILKLYKHNRVWFLYFLSLMPYFLTHNMLRNPLLWFFIFLAFYMPVRSSRPDYATS